MKAEPHPSGLQERAFRDLETEAIAAAHVTTAERGNAAACLETLILAQARMTAAGTEAELPDMVVNTGYHDNQLLAAYE